MGRKRFTWTNRIKNHLGGRAVNNQADGATTSKPHLPGFYWWAARDDTPICLRAFGPQIVKLVWQTDVVGGERYLVARYLPAGGIRPVKEIGGEFSGPLICPEALLRHAANSSR